jgi:ribulose-5-phosphate 4-epimerase/fuculose-1-phosphate aldolase
MDLSFLRRAVAEACRVLAHEGLAADVLGHVSVRVDQDTLLVRCRGPHESGLLFTTPDDVHLVGLDGQHDLPAGYTVPGELPIHVETLRSRPDVIAVVHAHPPAVVAADLAGLALRPIIGAFNIPAMRMAHRGVPVYPRAVLIRRAELAAGDRPADLPEADIAELPDLGATLNEENVWRYQLARLSHAGLGL